MEIGQQFGKLTVTGFGRNRFGQKTAACRCECGRDTATTQTRLTVGRSNSCGCLRQRTRRVIGTGETVLAHLLTTYKAAAKQKGRVFELGLDDFRTLVTSPCLYCAEPPNHVDTYVLKSGLTEHLVHHGVDRVDSSLGYTSANTVTCCKTCNYAKGDLSLDEFCQWALQEQSPVVVEKLHKTVLSNFYGTCKYQARRRGILFTLTKEDARRAITSTCHYCGTAPRHVWKAHNKTLRQGFASSPVNGIDRVDNGKGYTVENIVPCCQTCNYAKRGMILEEFRTWLAKLRTNLRLETAKVLATDSGIKASVTACHGESYH